MMKIARTASNRRSFIVYNLIARKISRRRYFHSSYAGDIFDTCAVKFAREIAKLRPRQRWLYSIKLRRDCVRDTQRRTSFPWKRARDKTYDIAGIDRSRGHDCSITTTAARRAFPTIERSLAGLSSGCALKSPFNLLQGVSGSHAASSHAADLPPCWGLYMCAQRAPWESARSVT